MSRPDLLVRGARHNDAEFDLLVGGGTVLELAPAGARFPEGAPEGVEVLDAGGKLLLPSLIDAHVHLREPGFEYKEDIASGLDAAVHGGFGAVMCMANTEPVNDNATVTELMLDRAAKAWPSGPRLHPVGALTKGLQGKELAPMAELARVGCVAVSNDGLPVASTEIMRRAMEYAATFGLRVIDHCEDPFLAPGAGVNEGRVSAALGLKGQPAAAEAIQVARDIQLAAWLDLPIHLAHISCRESVELIAAAKAKGVPVTAETCPHYLVFTEDAVEGYSTAAKVSPPLRTRDDVMALRQALREGIIDILVTDHAPHADHEKEVPFEEAPNGITGLDTALSLAWKLAADSILSVNDLVKAMAWNPAEIFGLAVNRFQPGDPADFTLFDPDELWTVTPEALRSKGKNTPTMGTALPGRVTAHVIGGRRVV